MWILFSILTLILLYSLAPTVYFKFKRVGNSNNKQYEKFLALTFDDGPDEKYTEKLLDLLKNFNIKATFFVVGNFAYRNNEIIKRMLNEGHIIGLHSLEHKNALFKGPAYTNKEFKKSIKIMNDLNVNVKFFRPPWGHLNLLTIFNLKKYNLKLVLWDVIIGDWKSNVTSEEIAKRLLSETKNKNIICLHDGRGRDEAPLRTIEALEKVLPIWIEQGYKFLGLGEVYEASN